MFDSFFRHSLFCQTFRSYKSILPVRLSLELICLPRLWFLRQKHNLLITLDLDPVEPCAHIFKLSLFNMLMQWQSYFSALSLRRGNMSFPCMVIYDILKLLRPLGFEPVQALLHHFWILFFIFLRSTSQFFCLCNRKATSSFPHATFKTKLKLLIALSLQPVETFLVLFNFYPIYTFQFSAPRIAFLPLGCPRR